MVKKLTVGLLTRILKFAAFSIFTQYTGNKPLPHFLIRTFLTDTDRGPEERQGKSYQ